MLIDIKEPKKNSQNSDDIIVGIDFGTTNSLISYCDDSGARVIASEDGKELFHSVVSIDGHKISSIKRLYGKSYEEVINGDFVSNSFKKILSKDKESNIEISLGAKKYKPVEIGAEIFKILKKSAEKDLNKSVKKAVVTVPAYFDDAAKSLVKLSASIAGFEVERLIAEPTAAAYFYGLDEKVEGNYLVYDIGGGTFDVSILEMKMGAFKVLAVGGNPELGGDDIDLALAQYLTEKYDLNIEDEDHFLHFCREIKERKGDHDLISKYNVIDIELDKSEVNEIVYDIVKPTISITKKVIFDSKVKNINGIILVGGTTKLSIVKELLKTEFPRINIIDSADPDKVVALGAARQARNLQTKSGDLLIDAIPLSLGIEMMGGIVEKIIERNSSIPAIASRKFTTYIDNQTGIDIHIVQGDRELAKDCRSLAKFKLKNIPPMIAGKAQVEVVFKVDADGLLSVSAAESISGSKQEVIIKPSYGLSHEEAARMLNSAMENAAKDYEVSKLIDKKIELRSILIRLNELLAKNGNILNDSEIESIKSSYEKVSTNFELMNYNEVVEAIENLENKSIHFIEEMLSEELSGYLKGKEIKNFVE